MICLVLFHLLSEKFEENKMKSLCFSSSSSLPHLLFCLLVIMHAFPVLLSNPELLYKNCRNEVFKCGDIHAGYPFYGGDRLLGCGHPGLELRCDNDSNTTTIEIVGVKYEVRGIQHDSTILRIAREDFIKNGFCKPQTPIQNSIIDPELFDDDPDYTNVTLFYDCPSSISSGLPQSSCLNHSHYKNVTVSRDNIRVDGCLANVTIPTSQTWWKRYSKHPPFPKALGEEFKGLAVKWKEEWEEACRKCNASRGACGFGFGNQTFCHCPRPYMNWPEFPNECPPPSPAGHKKGVNLGRILGFGIAGAAATVFFLFGIGILLVRQQRRKKIAAQVISRDLPTSPSSKGKTTSTTNTSQTNSSYYTSRYDIERGSTYFGVHVFDYEELEEATDNFNPSKQLGEGGFGTVYYGVLQDERVVAVKRLYENNLKCVNQYMNEIEILTLLRHPNLVTLYGCTSRRSRELLLVYEYIPNGTVADHLHGKGANSGSLTWNVRLSIAIETATALTYLHKKEIIHRDVKSNNILLDKNFHVKVADFGLSRLFPTDVTHVSTAPQGTPGYVDPEYHQCYHLTEKSDVYSFGVVLVELVSAKKAVDTSRHRHDINLANMAISRIQNQALHELVDPSLGFENDCEVKNSVTAVSELAFRCVQQERELRPSMEEVLETLREIKDVRTEAEVVEIRSDDVGQLKNITPPLPPDYRTDKWARIRSM